MARLTIINHGNLVLLLALIYLLLELDVFVDDGG